MKGYDQHQHTNRMPSQHQLVYGDALGASLCQAAALSVMCSFIKLPFNSPNNFITIVRLSKVGSVVVGFHC